MDFSKIEELLNTENKSAAALAKKEQYIELMVGVLNEQGFSETSTNYLRKGFSFSGAKPIVKYLSGLDKDVAEEKISNLFRCDLFKSKNRSRDFQICVSLMGLALEEFDIDRKILQECIMLMPSISKTRRGKANHGMLLNDAPKIVEKHLVGAVSADTKLPALDSIGIKEIFVNEFKSMMISILEKIQNAPSEKIEKFMLWVDPTRQEKVPRNAEETNEVQNEKEVASSNEEKSEIVMEDNGDHNSPEKTVIAVEGEQMKAEESTPAHTPEMQQSNRCEPAANMRQEETQGSAETDEESAKSSADIQKKNTENEVRSVKKATTASGSEMAQGAALLFNLAENMTAWATKMEEMACKNGALEKNNDDLVQRIEQLQTELAKEKAEYLAAQTEIEKNKKTIASLKAQLSEVQRGNAELQVQSTTTHEEIERLNSILSVYSADKENAQREQLNSIAAKLRTEYRDFKDAENDEMTVDLGENFRFQLTQVFKILIKAGIDVEKR